MITDTLQTNHLYQFTELPSGGSSPRGDNSGDVEDFNLMLRSQLYASQFANNLAGGFLQDTLFDEGLRIAQQYGMADFAQELKQMHPTGDESNETEVRDSVSRDSVTEEPAVSDTNGVKSTENGQSPQNNGDSVLSESQLKVTPIKLATTNGIDFAVKTEPLDSVPVEMNGS